MPDRMYKINELIRQEVAREIQALVSDEIISVTGAKVSKDLSYAKIWIAAYGDNEKAVKKCQAVRSEIMQSIAKKLILRKVPKLQFVADNTDKEAYKIDKLLDELKKESK